MPRHAPPPDLRHDYGGFVRAVTVGPRREVVLTLELWPVRDGRPAAGWRAGEGDAVTVRFGAVEEFDRVGAFFAALPASRSFCESLHYLRYAPDRESQHRPGGLWAEMQWDRTGEEVRFACGNVVVSDRAPAGTS